MNNQRRTAHDWQAILMGQGQTNQRDAEYAQSVGVSVQSLRAWRQKLKKLEPVAGTLKFVEVTSLVGSSALKVILPNGIRLEVMAGLNLDHLRQVVGLLRSL
ncbi:MAG: IS66 family insertion sequence element accessory protein TnpA [Rhabdochlamydiaceae bacterium]